MGSITKVVKKTYEIYWWTDKNVKIENLLVGGGNIIYVECNLWKYSLCPLNFVNFDWIWILRNLMKSELKKLVKCESYFYIFLQSHQKWHTYLFGLSTLLKIERSLSLLCCLSLFILFTWQHKIKLYKIFGICSARENTVSFQLL